MCLCCYTHTHTVSRERSLFTCLIWSLISHSYRNYLMLCFWIEESRECWGETFFSPPSFLWLFSTIRDDVAQLSGVGPQSIKGTPTGGGEYSCKNVFQMDCSRHWESGIISVALCLLYVPLPSFLCLFWDSLSVSLAGLGLTEICLSPPLQHLHHCTRPLFHLISFFLFQIEMSFVLA